MDCSWRDSGGAVVNTGRVMVSYGVFMVVVRWHWRTIQHAVDTALRRCRSVPANLTSAARSQELYGGGEVVSGAAQDHSLSVLAWL